MMTRVINKYGSTRSQIYFKIGILKFHKFHRKTPVLELLFDKVAGPKACIFSCDICKLFKEYIFYRTHPVAASENNDQQYLSEVFTQ